ncbi:hypothetical protein O181_040954 [Austropuccinia psidii MF-1]|uniref:Uncharacterized protein n=1 Tax=Austropuccinia psidii MF-1 TaxID=1389203 RepID=A0A9Q3DDH2_9BASI|nr:hypothetical protein [Austropuccinia psidii MF-1]
MWPYPAQLQPHQPPGLYICFWDWGVLSVFQGSKPLLAQSNEAKRGQTGQTTSPKPQVGPPEPVFDHGLHSTNLGQELKEPPVASGNPQRPPAQLKSTLPPNSRERFPIPPCTPYSRMQEWFIYGIIYHYAPFLLRNPMVMLSGPNYMIPNQGPKIHHQFQRRTLQLISLEIHGSYQKTISGPQPPGPLGVGLAILPGLFQGPFLEVIHHSISCKGRKYFNTPWKTPLVHTVSNQASCMALAQMGQLIFHCGNLITQFQFSRWPELYLPNSDNTAG